MEKIRRVVLNLIFSLQVLLFFLLFVEDKVHLPAWLQVAGRMHPLVLHLPIGVAVFLLVFLLVQRQLLKDTAHQVVNLALLFTSLTASVTALFGFFLSLQSDYGVEALTRHKISGVVLSFFCYAILIGHNNYKSKPLFLGLGIVSFITLLFAGHTGAVLTHGENFVLAPISKSKIVLTADNASLYHFAVEPILERKCFSCHNESKAKGGLIMTTADQFMAGGDNGKPWVEGKPAESRMIKAFYLPLSHDEHMPPDGKPQLTQAEIRMLKAWIKSGADFEKKLAQFPETDSLKIAVASLEAAMPSQTAMEQTYTFASVSEDAIEKLNTPYRSVFRLYEGSPALQADFFVRKSFEPGALEELKAVEEQLVVLNLSKMPVADKDLSVIKSFRNLEHLNLNFSSIQGSGLTELNTLKNLKSLSLSGTSVDAAGLTAVLKLPNLQDVFVWGTKIGQAQLDSLSVKYPAVSILNTQYRDDAILKLNKPMLDQEADVIRKGEPINLKHPMTGVTIYYTLDGSDPDTVKGQTYQDAFNFTETVVLKARACKDAWFCSDVFETTCFVEGLKPTQIELLTTPDPKYPGEGAQSLSDHRKGFADVLKEPSWIAYRNQPFEAGFGFTDSPVALKEIVISYARNIGAYSFPPAEVEVWAGKDKSQLKLIKKMAVDQPTGYQSLKVDALSIPLSAAPYSYYKVVAKPVARLPQWHNGKGEKGWVFVDEMFFY